MKTVKFLAFICIFLCACSLDKEQSIETRISGYYRITSIESSIKLDLNNDGIKTEDLYAEIGGLHIAPDNQKGYYYDFNFAGNYMEVRPLEGATNDGQLIAINFPEQWIGELTPSQFFLHEYSHAFIHYSYELDSKSHDIELINNNPQFDENGSLQNLELLADGSLKLELKKDFFDFVDLKWIEADVVVLYEKLE
jgi:hypothetical protein